MSEYSPPQNICVFLPPGTYKMVYIHVQESTITLFLLSGGPDAAQEVSVEFEEDLREEFLQHAILTLSWESPAS